MRNEAVVDSELADAALLPRTGSIVEEQTAPGEFGCTAGPFRTYRRVVTVEAASNGRMRVLQEVEHRLDIPFFWLLFAWPIRRDLRRIRPPHSTPWWAPPDTVDAHGARALGTLAALSLVCGYLGTMLTQTITFAADEFRADTVLQGRVLAATRIDIVLALIVVWFVDRKGRRAPLLAATAGGCVFTALGALSPSLYWLGASQVVAKGLVGGALIAIAIVGAEEMPAGSRAYSFSLLTMSGALGAGLCVGLLAVADSGERGWRLLYALSLVWLLVVWRASRHLPESRRFERPHVNATMAGHGGRFWLLAISA
ncbi:MAG TPA: MFS transporter, partial [Acidimicrobiales bacterium]|nr:MFS transporter [Acidimicrobiales bacterium]